MIQSGHSAVPAAHSYVAEGRLRTLGSWFFVLLLQAESGAVPEGQSSSIVSLLARSNVLTKAVLLILALFSIVSWSIILYKLWTFRRSERQSGSFLDVFRRSKKFSDVQAVCGSLGESPLVGLFQAGYAELTAQLRQHTQDGAAAANPAMPASRPTLKSLASVDRALLRASAVEVNKLESRISFLAAGQQPVTRGRKRSDLMVSPQPRRAAVILATSIFFMSIIASNARLASAPPAESASISTRGVICQESPHLSLHQPHSLS